MAYKILPGVRQDHRGRLYQNAVYPNGKTIAVPYSVDGAPPARMIPVVEAKPAVRAILTIRKVDMTKRRMRVDFRVRGETEVRTTIHTNELGEQFVAQHRAVCSMRMNEKTGVEELNIDQHGNPRGYLFPGNWDWFVQQHVDLKGEING